MSETMKTMRRAIKEARARFGDEPVDFREIDDQTIFPEEGHFVFYIGPMGTDPRDITKWMKFRWN